MHINTFATISSTSSTTAAPKRRPKYLPKQFDSLYALFTTKKFPNFSVFISLQTDNWIRCFLLLPQYNHKSYCIYSSWIVHRKTVISFLFFSCCYLLLLTTNINAISDLILDVLQQHQERPNFLFSSKVNKINRHF